MDSVSGSSIIFNPQQPVSTLLRRQIVLRVTRQSWHARRTRYWPQGRGRTARSADPSC